MASSGYDRQIRKLFRLNVMNISLYILMDMFSVMERLWRMRKLFDDSRASGSYFRASVFNRWRVSFPRFQISLYFVVNGMLGFMRTDSKFEEKLFSIANSKVFCLLRSEICRGDIFLNSRFSLSIRFGSSVMRLKKNKIAVNKRVYLNWGIMRDLKLKVYSPPCLKS